MKLGGWKTMAMVSLYEDEVVLNPKIQPVGPPLKSLEVMNEAADGL